MWNMGHLEMGLIRNIDSRFYQLWMTIHQWVTIRGLDYTNKKVLLSQKAESTWPVNLMGNGPLPWHGAAMLWVSHVAETGLQCQQSVI